MLTYLKEAAEKGTLSTPCYVVEETALLNNLKILKEIADRGQCKILLAQKAFSMFHTYPLIRQYLSGTTASGLYEARLGKEEFGGETHVFSPAYREEEFEELLEYGDHIVFNSCSQVRRFGERARAAGKSVGLRINPECSTQEGHEIYDPCGSASRLGTTLRELDQEILPLLDGLHFHTLCEQNSDALARTLEAVEEKFGCYLKNMKWLNLGGGHHITRADYDRELLLRLLSGLHSRYDLTLYLEPGEAVVLHAGYLAARVLDLHRNEMELAILDTSAACHMPDVLEMPYRPPLMDSGVPGEKPYLYRLAGPTCLAGDRIGDYSFDHPLSPGDLLVFEDMALYTMVKNNTFNGMPLPSIYWKTKEGDLVLVRKFSYEDFKSRLS